MKNKKILFIALGALVLIAAVAAICIAVPKDDPADPQLESTTPTAPAHIDSDSELQTETVIYDYYPMVTFVTNNNQITQRVTPGTLPQIPDGQSGYDNLVFTGWNAPITAVTEDVTYEAIYEDISEKDNVFVLDTLYTTENSAQVTLSLRGKVKLSVADLQISYDPNVIRVEDIVKVDSSVLYNIIPEEGRIKVSILLEDNLEYAMDCFKMNISFVDPEADLGQLDITVDNAAVQDAAGNTAKTASETISGKIVLVTLKQEEIDSL